MNAEQYAEEFPALHYNRLIDDTDIQAICEMLRRLAAVESDCAPYLKEGETPAERIKRDLADADSLMSLYRDVIAERDALKAELERIKALPPAAWRSSMWHGVTLKETIPDEQRALTWDGKPMWQPLIALGSKTDE